LLNLLTVLSSRGLIRVTLTSLVCGALLIPASATSVGATSVPTKVTRSGETTLSVKPTKNLTSTGARIKVRGKGFDRRIGIYVALCVTPKKGSTKAPGPCGGGVNLTASDPASAWISSNPPPYGSALAIPFSKRGKFSVTLTVSPKIGKIDCRNVSCSIVTRADHTKPSFRGADLYIPVSFT
jgi:hypothetical protein